MAKIPVKKADGSIEYMTMDEFRAYKASKSNASPASNDQSAESPKKETSSIVPEKGQSTPVQFGMTDDTTSSSTQSPASPRKKRRRKRKKKSQNTNNGNSDKPSQRVEFGLTETSKPKNIEQKKSVPAEPAPMKIVQKTITKKKPLPPKKMPVPIPPRVKAPVSPPPVTSEKSEKTNVPVSTSAMASQPSKEQEKKIETNASLTVPPKQALSTSTPVRDYFKDEAIASLPKRSTAPEPKAPTLEATDFRSPLEEDIEHHEVSDPHLTKQTALDPVPLVLGKLSFDVPENLHQRLYSLIVSRRKDVRTDEQVLANATKDADKGGLGLSEEQAATLLSTIKEVFHIGAAPRASVTLNRPASVKTIATPVPSEGMRTMSTRGPRAKMHDVAPPSPSAVPAPQTSVPQAVSRPTTMGPVDELRSLGIVEFRRLGQTPEDAAHAVLAKLDTLFQESYLLYMDAKKGWLESPLHLAYLGALRDAMQQGQPVAALLTGGDTGLSPEEFRAVQMINRELT